jgi:hypothetical protein
MDGVSFFGWSSAESRPRPERGARPHWAKPEAILPASVPADLILARSDAAAVAVGSLQVYPTGFAFLLTAVVREEHEYGLPAVDIGMRHRLRPGQPLPDAFLRFGIAFADGRSATNLSDRHAPDPDASDGPLLSSDGGGGGSRTYEMRHWVWPLPPPGPVDFVCEWPAHGIGESRASLDASLIRDAASRAITLWPQD